MTVYSASFIRPGAQHTEIFNEACRLIDERNRAWLAVSPEHLAAEHTVRAHPTSPWLSIQNAIGNDLLQEISQELACETLSVYAIDEHVLEFRYSHFKEGVQLRALTYGSSDIKDPAAVEKWNNVEGEKESWEPLLFSSTHMHSYEQYAPAEEVSEIREQQMIRLGFHIPWACDGDIVCQIAEHLHLPWNPVQDSFEAANQSRVIQGSPERWKQLHRSHRPWWRFW